MKNGRKGVIEEAMFAVKGVLVHKDIAPYDEYVFSDCINCRMLISYKVASFDKEVAVLSTSRTRLRLRCQIIRCRARECTPCSTKVFSQLP